jgi:hypothetical protein
MSKNHRAEKLATISMVQRRNAEMEVIRVNSTDPVQLREAAVWAELAAHADELERILRADE